VEIKRFIQPPIKTGMPRNLTSFPGQFSDILQIEDLNQRLPLCTRIIVHGNLLVQVVEHAYTYAVNGESCGQHQGYGKGPAKQNDGWAAIRHDEWFSTIYHLNIRIVKGVFTVFRLPVAYIIKKVLSVGIDIKGIPGL
jgi:hypothetical protein